MSHEQFGAAGDTPADWARPTTGVAAVQAWADSPH